MTIGLLLASGDSYVICLNSGNDFVKVLGSVISAIIPAACIGCFVALKVVMTSMPELVAGFHSFVGLAATLIGFGSFFADEQFDFLYLFIFFFCFLDIYIFIFRPIGGFAIGMHRCECYLGIFIGAVTFTGSIIAFGKLV
jgi:NAD/NADP transhydrogenase beta subunit